MFRALSLSLLLTGCAHLPPESPEQIAHKATHLLTFDGGDTCSGTMIAPTVVLTASHCLRAPLVLVGMTPVNVLKVEKDGADHAWLTIDAPFEHTAPMGAEPAQGDEVFIYGNPGEQRDMLRRGYMSGTDGLLMVFDLPVSFGDSGAAIFNTKGEVVGMVMGFKLYPSGMQMTASGRFGTKA